MKKSQRKVLRNCIRELQSKFHLHLSETEHAFLNHLANHLPKRKKNRKDSGKGNGNNFFSAN
jgi:hypothetical protein